MTDKRVGILEKYTNRLANQWRVPKNYPLKIMEFHNAALADLDACELTVEELAELINREFLPEEGKKWEWAKKLAGEIVEAREKKRREQP